MCKDSNRFVMVSRYHLVESMKWQLIGRLKARQPITEADRLLNISKQSVRYGNNLKMMVKIMPGQGRKRMMTASKDRYLAITVRRNRKSTACQIGSEIVAATGTAVTWQMSFYEFFLNFSLNFCVIMLHIIP